MPKSLPVSDSQKHCLKYFPKENHCRFNADVSTIKNLTNVIIYLLFKNGTFCWYYVENVRDNILYGYKRNFDSWNYTPIDLRKIRTYY